MGHISDDPKPNPAIKSRIPDLRPIAGLELYLSRAGMKLTCAQAAQAASLLLTIVWTDQYGVTFGS